jgi:Predicted membrane protein
MQQHDLISKNVEEKLDQQWSFGERLADKIATFGGSWAFLICFTLFLAVWILVNTVVMVKHPADPYPFILLNLMLSCLAAIQAPIIMMSQNRQEAKDRMRSENDYQVNLKAELEIRHLHEKIDHLLMHQWDRLAKIQEIQLDLLSEMSKKKQ